MKRTMMLGAVLLSTVAAAQTDPPPDARHQRVTKVSFDDDDVIDGEAEGPDLELISTPERAKHGSIIRIREEFRDKVLDSVAFL